jgi:hypothetical protein
MEATVPIIVIGVVVLILLPTLTSLRKAVPTPTTFTSFAVTVIVPERCVFGQALDSQVPLPILVMVKLVAPAGLAGNPANSIMTIVKTAAVLYKNGFVFIALLGSD